MALETGIDLASVLAGYSGSNMSKLGADGKPVYLQGRQGPQGPDYFPLECGLCCAVAACAERIPCDATITILCVVQFWPCLTLDFAPGRPWPS